MFYPLKGIAPRDPAREFLFFEPDRALQRETLQLDLVDGREMELIKAEVELRNGNWQAAMALINNVRTTAPVYPIDMTDQNKFDLRLHPAEQTDWGRQPRYGRILQSIRIRVEGLHRRRDDGADGQHDAG